MDNLVNTLRKLIESVEPKFKDGGPLERFFPIFEATESFLFSTSEKTKSGPHIRDSVDIKRVMILVVLALIPCYIFGAINIGVQAGIATGKVRSIFENFIFGMGYIAPIILVTFIAGGFWEVLFAVVRNHDIYEGFLVTCALIPLLMPPTIPLWQFFVATSFGIVIGKEIFGGVGYNIFNPALVTRAFIYFAYPTEIAGDKVWLVGPDGYSGATALAIPAATENNNALDLLNNVTQFDFSWINMLMGYIPGSIGETNKIIILLGALFLIYVKIASWRIMISAVFGLFFTAILTNILAPFSSNTMLSIPPHYHLVMGSFMFGVVFMATEPVTSAHTNRGKWIYGFFIGSLTVIIRSINPAYPEGIMLAILLMNAFAPLIDYFVVQKNINQRKLRYAK